ncbi:MAG: cysteine desulfurase [Planctomycetaceae bacterium]|nr:cysteine desulfurase [Planctomycetales bacterium]MCB9927682.1 cysteine desulfurase [Planctomycetaceae bacterium]
MRQIYLDYNATTPIAPSVQEAMLPFLAEHYGNPSSNHALGRACHEAIEDSRERVASLLGADRDEILFTGGGTESNNLAIKGVMLARAPVFDGHLIISALEHPAVAEPARYIEKLGCRVSVVGCDADGVVKPDAIAALLRPDTKLVSIMHANNEIGTVQPLKAISEVCRSKNVLFHTDAAQSIGKIRTYVEELGVDMLTIAGHKLYAPKGVGALYVRQGVALEPYTHGAAHEGGLRPGTENTAFIVALGHACFLAGKAVEDASDRMADLRDRLAMKLRDAIGSELTINGARAERLPNTLSVNFPDVSGGELLARTPEIAASTGSACHAGLTKLSPTLAAIRLAPDRARGTVRLSVGWYTSEEDIDRAAELLIGAWESLR